MRFRNRLLILVVAILLPAFIGAAIAVAYVYFEQQKDQERGVAETAHAFALLIDNEMCHQEGILRTLAASPALQEGDMAEFYAHAQRAAEGVGAVAILYDTAGKTVLNTRRPLGIAVPGRDLLLGLNVYIVQHFPATWIATVADRNGRIVARSRDAAQYVGTPLRAQTRARIAANDELVAFDSETLDGIPVRALASTVPNTGWKVLISIPTAEIQRVPIRAAALLAGIMSVLLVLALAAGRWFSNRATAPIEYLGRCADRLGNGEEVAYHPHGLEEIDNMARRMTEASKQIQRSQRELEQRVSEAIRATEQAQGALLKSQRLESLGRLTAGIAHEFNNLLRTLTTALQPGAMLARDPKLQGLIDTCKRTSGAPPSSPASSAPSGGCRKGSGSLPFVEDDPLVRDAVAGGLRQAGFTVRVADSGDAALALLDGGLQVDVVFFDIVMPGGISGIDLARAVRRRWPALPVVLATGYTERRVALPDVPVLAKPYDIAQAVSLLGALVAHH